MMQLWENLLERPKWQRVSMWIGSLVFLSFVFYQFVYSSKLEEFQKLDEKLSKLQAQVATETAIVNNLPRFRKEVEKLNELHKVAIQKLPQKREMPTLLESVSNLAKDSGLDVKRFAPRTDSVRDFYAEIPVDIEMRGTFHKVVTFFDELARMSRIVNVQDILMNQPRGYRDSEGVEIDVKGVLKTFRYLEPEERIQTGAPAAGDKNAGRRRK